MSAALPSNAETKLTGHQGPVLVVRFNGDGNYCLSGGQDRSVRLWNPHRSNLVKTYRGHGYEVLDIAVTHDNERFASCGGDKAVFLWDVATGRIIRRLRGHASDAMQVLDDFKDSVSSLAVVHNEIIAGSIDGCIRRYDIRAGTLTTDTIARPVTWLALSNDSNCILCSSLDSTIRLFDKQDAQLLSEYVGHVNKEYKVEACLTNTDEAVVSGSEDGNLLFWNLVNGAVVQTLKGHKGVVCSIAYHPSQPCVLSASVDGSILVWK